MRELVSRNRDLILIFILWYVFSLTAGSAFTSIFILFCLILFKLKSNYKAIFFGLITIIIMSDSRAGALTYTSSLKVIYVLAMIAFLFLDKDRFQPLSEYYKPFLPFFAFSIPLIFLNPTPFSSFQRAISYNLIFFIIPNYFLVCFKEEGEQFLKDLICFLCLVLLISIIIIPIYREDILFINGRYNGLLGNPNGMGLYVSLLFIFHYITDQLFPNLFSRQEKILNFSLILFSIFYCGSRNAIITILIFYAFIRFFKISYVLGVISMLLIVLLKDLIGDFMLYLVDAFGLSEFYRVENVDKGSGRLVAWIFGWENVQENFFFGRGFNYTNYLYRLNFDKLARLGHQGNAHNSYLTIWLDTGIIGLILLLRGLFLSYIRVFNVSPLFLPALLSILFSMFFESWFAASLNPFMFQVIGISLLGVVYNQKNEMNNNIIVS
jgi:O-antigen ligase